MVHVLVEAVMRGRGKWCQDRQDGQDHNTA
jgi:hypothetical protein